MRKIKFLLETMFTEEELKDIASDNKVSFEQLIDEQIRKDFLQTLQDRLDGIENLTVIP